MLGHDSIFIFTYLWLIVLKNNKYVTKNYQPLDLGCRFQKYNNKKRDRKINLMEYDLGPRIL